MVASRLASVLAIVALLAIVADAASPTFPMFSSYAGKPYTVSYDRRSIRLNDQPVAFLSGSIHYPRSTPAMWPQLMKQAAADGLNMIQIYVFWNWHQPTEDAMDWTGRGNLTLFLDAIAEAGLFANLRIGPYVCAEWDYGGIPTWLAYKDGVRFRAYNQPWMAEVTQWMKTVVAVTRPYFADHGGPIVLAQVENELNGADQRYVDWNGQLAASLNVNIPWIMCNGQSANNTINACNGNDCAGFIESNGQSGRIMIDQPALWTENEGWFESWGDSTHPEPSYSDREPAEISYTVARWFARGGVRAHNTHAHKTCECPHLQCSHPCLCTIRSFYCRVTQSHHNYYMYHGGNHYDKSAAAGLTNMYANGVNLNADGLPNEPKHNHLNRLHYAIAQVSGDLLASDAQYKSGVALPWRYNASDSWRNGTEQLAFVYGQTVFIESSAPVFVQTQYKSVVYDMAAGSVLIVQDGELAFNTSEVQVVNAKRVNTPVWDAPLAWQVWSEGVYSASSAAATDLAAGLPAYKFTRPVEQLNVTRDLTEYCWYSTSFTATKSMATAALTIDSGTAQSFIAYIDSMYVGTCYNQVKNWPYTADWLCNISVSNIKAGTHSLSLLSSALGIENGMGPGEVPYENHWKGVRANGKVAIGSLDLTMGGWTLRPYLTGEYLGLPSASGHSSVLWSSEWQAATGQPLTWYYAQFPAVTLPTTGSVYSVLIDMSGFTRGHAFINGHDIGRYWLIAGRDGQPTQSLYHIPQDWLSSNNQTNTLTIIEEVGMVDATKVGLYVSQLQAIKEEPRNMRELAGVAME